MAEWHIATLVTNQIIAKEIHGLKFQLPEPLKLISGQHFDIRLTSENGYSAERSYSLLSAPEENNIAEFGIQILPDGEVSPYLAEMQPGDQIELRGPIGRHFNWQYNMPGPLIMIAGGSGVVPMISMLRHAFNHKSEEEHDIILLLSVRTLEHIINVEEIRSYQSLSSKFKFVPTLTMEQPLDWVGYKRRVDQKMIEESIIQHLRNQMSAAHIFICGPTAFVEAVASILLDLKISPEQIKTERFGG